MTSRDIQIYSQNHLPAAQDDLFAANNALGMPGAVNAGAPNSANSPLRKVSSSMVHL